MNSRIYMPNMNGHRTMHVSEVTKSQMARAVNEQRKQIDILRQQALTMGRLLMAITVHPEAFHYDDDDGCVTIDASAIKDVPEGSTLTVKPSATVVTLSVQGQEERPAIDAPRILVPPGVN